MKFLEFLGARRFSLRTATTRFLNFTPAPSRNGFRNLKFTSVPRNRFGILKFTRASARLADTAQNFILQRGFKILKFIQELPFAPRCVLPRVDSAETGRAARLTSQHTHDVIEKQSAVKFNHAGRYLNSARRYIARFRSAAARHGYEVGRAEKLSKFNLTGALLNFTSRFAMQLCSAVTRRNYEAWRSEIYAVCLHKYPALIRAASGKISLYEVGQATNASLSQGVQRMKFCAQKRHAIKFLKFLGARRFGLQVAVGRRFEILKFMRASARLADTAQNFISRNGFKILKFICAPLRALHRVLPNADKAEAGRGCSIAEKQRAVKLAHAGGYLNSARRCIVRLCGTAVRHGYEVGRAEKFSKFSLAATLLNSISLPPRKFKPALLKFTPAPPRNRSEILKFTPKLSNRFEILKFTLARRKFKLVPCKFKSTPAVRLNFALNSVPLARAAKFENGVKFKGTAKFERGAR